MSYEEQVERSVVKFIDSKDRILGSGFWVLPNGYGVTCYHVIAGASKRPPAIVRIEFNGQILQVQYRPELSAPSQDIAVFNTTDETVPPVPFVLLGQIKKFDIRVRLFGYREGLPLGYTLTGELQPGQNSGVGELYNLVTSMPDTSSVGGMSGAPVFDPQNKMVVGLQYGEEAAGPSVSYVHPISKVFSSWSELPAKNSSAFKTQMLMPSTAQQTTLTPGRWHKCAPNVAYIRSLAVDPNDPDIIYVGMNQVNGRGGAIYRSFDGGLTWQAANHGLPEDIPDVNALVVSGYDGKIYAGTDNGIFESVDQGRSWRLHDRFSDREVRCLSLPLKGDSPFICGTGKYFCGTTISSVSIGIISSEGSEGLLANSSDISSGDLHVSTNSGISWFTAPIRNINAAAISPADNLVVYIGTSDMGIFRSEDGGNRWAPTDKLEAEHVFSLRASPENVYQVFAGTNKGLFKSNDGGDTWQKVEQIVSDQIMSIAFSPADPKRVYVGTRNGVYESRDGGDTWQTINKGLINLWVMALEVLPDGTIFAGTSGGGVFKKGANQFSWQPMNVGFAGLISGLALAAYNDKLIYLGTPSGIFRTQNEGNSWKQVGYFTDKHFQLDYVWSIEIAPNHMGEISGSRDDLYLSSDRGQSWQSSSEIQVAPIYAGTGEGFIYKSMDGGASWQKVSDAVGSRILAIDISTPNIIYAATEGKGILRSLNEGGSWEFINEGLEDLYVATINTAPNNSQRLYAGTGKGLLYRSNDGGDSWESCAEGLTDKPILSIALSKNCSDLIYLGIQGDGVCVSRDQCSSWKNISRDLPNLHVTTVLLSPENDNWLYVGTAGGVYKSINGGESWIALSDGLEDKLPVNRLVVSPQNSRLIYAGVAALGVCKLIDKEE